MIHKQRPGSDRHPTAAGTAFAAGKPRRASSLCLAVVVMVGLGACERGGSSGAGRQEAAGGARQRVNAVAADPKKPVDPKVMCDVFHDEGDAPAFAWPELTGDAPALETTRWTWINVWATWCKPCVEELPRLRQWQTSLEKRVTIRYVSADESDEAIEDFRKRHPGLQDTARVADPDELPAWLSTLGLTGGALPVQVFVDAKGRVRCVRASAVEDSDAPAIDSLLQ